MSRSQPEDIDGRMADIGDVSIIGDVGAADVSIGCVRHDDKSVR
jgi:hypothetical protein